MSTDKMEFPSYTKGTEQHFYEWCRETNTRAKMHRFHHDILTAGTIKPGADREELEVSLRAKYRADKLADDAISARVDKYFTDLAKSISSRLYAALQLAVKGDDTLYELLADESAPYYDDVKAGVEKIKSLITSEDPNAKHVRTLALREKLTKAVSPDALKEVTSAALDEYKTGIMKANKLLKTTKYHLSDEEIEDYILAAICSKGANLGGNMRVQVDVQRRLAKAESKAFGLDEALLAMQGIVDQENVDRDTEAKAAAQTALVATHEALAEKLAAAQSKVAALEAQIKSNKGGGDRGDRGRKPCHHCGGLHGGRCLGDLICKEVPVDKVVEELPDSIDHATKVRMAKSSYKKVCAKHPGRTLSFDPFTKKSDSTPADYSEVRVALADSVSRSFHPDGVVGGFVAGVCTDRVEDTFPEPNTIDTPAMLKAKMAACNAAEARARSAQWDKFTSFVTALPDFLIFLLIYRRGDRSEPR